ncbi:UvrD-helicase domain-containing protein [Candidatus Curtissbacteria bacterium]|nr:UvrD-helicase domain-containing protein [Candidatus Curtissbacteria bacterium]
MADILKDLNPEQLKAVTTTEGPLLIIAGAGTGKTTVIARRIAHIIEKKLAKPSEILALTFTEKAAGEMEERVDVLVPYGFIDTWISTFHAFGDRVLRENAIEIGLTPNFKVFSRPQQVLFFQQNLFRFQLDYYRPLGNPNKFISAILSFFSRLKDENILPEDFAKFAQIQKGETEEEKLEVQKYNELAACYQSYEKFKDEAGFMDFGDLVTKAIDLFKRRPKILKNYQEQFKYILVDEYQDTNYSQNLLVNLLASAHKNICVVGDDDQSIYKFRGAAISNILEFNRTYKEAGQVVLTQNYRSTQSILDSAYKLIKHNDPDRLEVKNNIDKKLKYPQEIFASTISSEADCVAEEIEKLMSKNRKNKSEKLVAYKDFAILVRANSQADHFLRALNMKGIPHKFVGSSGLYHQPEVSLIISFLTAIDNFEDSLNLFNLLTSEIYDMPPVEAIKLTSFAKRKNRSLFYVLTNLEKISAEENLGSPEISEEAKTITDKVLEDLNVAIELSKTQNAGKVIYGFLKRTSYLTKLEREGGIENQLKVQNIAKFFDKVKEFQDVAKIETVSQFVDYLSALRDAGDDPATIEFDPDLDAVNVMTVHGAKGLEFPVVFMVNLVADRFPSRARSEAIELPQALIKETLPSGNWHLEEERRLFYVGITRAKDLVYFTWSKDVGGMRAKKISPFVLEALDKPTSAATEVRLSPIEKIEKFAPTPPRITQTIMFDVDVLKLTQGSIDDYLTCAYKYRYIHLLRVPILRHHAIAYGAALHNAIAAFFNAKKRGEILNLPQLLEVFENVWDSEGFLTIEHEEKRKAQGKLALEKFWIRESKNPEVPSLIEAGFKFNVKETLVVGRFDRVDVKAGGKIHIIDYKSSENIDQERADAQAKESTQLGIYALYYWKKHQLIPEKVSLHFLETGIEGSYQPTEKDLEKVENLIAETAEKIRSDTKNNTFAAKPKYFGREPACTYCAYNSICPFSLAKI